MRTDGSPRPLVVKITCAAEAAERSNQAWTVAALAAAAGAPVTVWLTGEAVWFAVPGRAPDLGLAYATPVVDLLATVLDLGSVVVCSQCAARRELTEPDLVAGAVIAGAATFVETVLTDGVQALVY
ncbi:MAG: sulfur reduction protein DsrE [Friedmanniella sp.]|nr:sulfur reduction protein DsrE [Friedmanniella sp.]